MKQNQFEHMHAEEWRRFGETLNALERRSKASANSATFPACYRRICQQLAIARSRGYSPYLVERLQALAMRGHQQLYRHRSHLRVDSLDFLFAGFPRLVRARYQTVLTAGVLFFGSLLGMAGLVLTWPELAYHVLDAERLASMEQMYDPQAQRLGRFAERGSLDDWAMFGFYIMNNIGIAFQTFAGGLLLGLGTLFFLLFNGLVIGTVAGHLVGIGYHEPFLSFVIGHGAFELTAIALAGAAGLELGWALLSPGRATRLAAVRQAARRAIRLVVGAMLMLIVAAFIEAFWSSMTYTSATAKYLVGTLLWVLVLTYFLRAGRSRATE